MTRLRDDRARVLARLEAAQGAFVPGRELAKVGGIPFEWLSETMRVIRKARPDLRIAAGRGKGYRLLNPDEPPEPARHKETLRDAMKRGVAMVDLLSPELAELVKAVALESGQPVQDAIERLLSYGLEVHRDLVVEGENPLALRRVA